VLPEIRADFDRMKSLIDASRSLPDGASGEADSMINEYLCVAISGRLEQNLKQIFIAYSERKSDRAMGTAVSRLCQSFQNPSKDKICDLVSLFDKDFSSSLLEEWKEDGSFGSTISDMIGKRKVIAHQTKNNRDTTSTKIDQFYRAYKEVVTRIHDHFLR
jgi:hypothetical protein